MYREGERGEAALEGERNVRPYIVREVVTAHGGTIGVVSNAEAGTTFTAELPLRPAPTFAMEQTF